MKNFIEINTIFNDYEKIHRLLTKIFFNFLFGNIKFLFLLYKFLDIEYDNLRNQKLYKIKKIQLNL